MIASNTSLKIGDVIVAYAPGFHIIEKIESYNHKLTSGGTSEGKLVYYKKIADTNGKLFNTKQVKCCNIMFCQKVNCSTIQKLIDEKEEEIKSLRKFALNHLIS